MSDEPKRDLYDERIKLGRKMSDELKRPSTNMICYKCKKEIFHDEDKTFISEYPMLYPAHVKCMVKITRSKNR